MSKALLEALILIVSATGLVMLSRDFLKGRSNLWMGQQRLVVSRVGDPFLFWFAICGWAALFIGLVALVVLSLLFSR